MLVRRSGNNEPFGRTLGIALPDDNQASVFEGARHESLALDPG